MPTFIEKLQAAAERNNSLLCVGLDPDPKLMPVADVAEFNRAIIEATSDLVCAYKPNLAFYEALGPAGHEALEETLKVIPSWIPVIGDSKRGDIGNTAAAYAKAMFGVWGFDCVTVNAFGGQDSVEPFLDYHDKGVLVWCRSSNPGARELQDLIVTPPLGGDSRPFYEWVAISAAKWNTHGNVGLVVGATYPDELEVIRDLCPDMPILIPGVGEQEGSLEKSTLAGIDVKGRNAIVSASRGVLYAGKDPATYPDDARNAALQLRDRMNAMLEDRELGWPPKWAL
jgi:orotidine-5'-phosphate decarboxylase